MSTDPRDVWPDESRRANAGDASNDQMSTDNAGDGLREAVEALREKYRTFEVAGNLRAHWLTDLDRILAEHAATPAEEARAIRAMFPADNSHIFPDGEPFEHPTTPAEKPFGWCSVCYEAHPTCIPPPADDDDWSGARDVEF